MFGNNEHIKLFPDGLKKDEIGNHDEREAAKNIFLESIHSYILQLEEHNLIDEKSSIPGSTFSFTPEKLASLSTKDNKNNPILNEKDVLEVLGVTEEKLKKQTPKKISSSTNKEYNFAEYRTNEPTLYYIKETKVQNSTIRYYFQITTEELEKFARREDVSTPQIEIKPTDLPKGQNSSPRMEKLLKMQQARLNTYKRFTGK